jgi:hypothetical protein
VLIEPVPSGDRLCAADRLDRDVESSFCLLNRRQDLDGAELPQTLAATLIAVTRAPWAAASSVK